MEHEEQLELPQPGRVERAKRALGFGTFHVVNMEDRSQSEQRMALDFMENGTKHFGVARSAEIGLKKFTRGE